MVNRILIRGLCFVVGIAASSGALAEMHQVRWTAATDAQTHTAGDFSTILQHLNTELHLQLTAADFFTYEERDLATTHFQTRLQLAAGIPIHHALIRVWSDLKTGRLIQMEASVEDLAASLERTSMLMKRQVKNGFALRVLTDDQTLELARKVVIKHESDRQIRDLKWRDEWNGNNLERIVLVRARRGTHTIRIDSVTARVIDSQYELYPQADIPALVYPIYEESFTGKLQPRVPKTLQNLREQTYDINADPYTGLGGNYVDSKLDPVKGATSAGQAAGFWSMQVLKEKAKVLRAQLPQRENSFARGIILDGLYASVNIHPEAVKKFGASLNFRPGSSGQFYPLWKTSGLPGEEINIMMPGAAYLGRPLTSANEGLTRVAERLPDHNPVTYINAGFDELQVYYAVNQLMDSMHAMGFSDPELSTRPFNAFLYDPDIAMKNNAYYTDDTINFTTYSPANINFARDNSTIWHELGHGVMDRLMGDLIHLSDSGGLAEGMADFVAALVIQDVTNGVPFDGSQSFRIINRTLFHVTNESHDDGEAYGGAMKDFLDAAVKMYGRNGLIKVTDLTLEAMRLARNHPSLDANAWFDHMLFADTMGSHVRAPGELAGLLKTALASRNFRLDNGPAAEFHVKLGAKELSNVGPGSRSKPIVLSVAAGQEQAFPLTVQLKSSPSYAFKYPIRVEVAFTGGALEGPVHWKNKEAGSQFYNLNSDAEIANIPLAAIAQCDAINLPDGGCSDYAYIRVWNSGEDHPSAKKRFYVRVKPAGARSLKPATF